MKTPRIEASFDSLLSQAATTVDLFLIQAIEIAEKRGFETSAISQNNKNILIIAKMIQKDFDTSCRAVSQQLIAEAIEELAASIRNQEFTAPQYATQEQTNEQH